MQRCAFTPYEGKKPYIFISYAHKDSHLVFPILEELDRRGYRVWYDDGIAPGSEWPENIAQHLDGCSLALAFISPNSIASVNCRREVTFALSKRKPFLGIMLQATEMSLGMEMQLSAQQCIMKYTYTSDEDFFRKVCSCPDLEPCLGQPKAVVVPTQQPVAPAAAAAEIAAAPKPETERKPVDKKLIGIVAGIAAAAALIAVVLAISLGSRGEGNPSQDSQPSQSTGTETPSDSTGPTDITGETVLSYSEQTITAEDVAHINRQTQLQTLEMRNCVVQDNALDSLILPETVTEIHLEKCSGITNLSGLLSLEGLVSLKLIDCGITDGDLVTLPGGELQLLDISGNPNFTNLEIFANCTQLTHIDFSNTGVSSLAALSGMEQLYAVNGSHTNVRDLAVVANMTGLREISFAGCNMESIDTPFYCLYLETLDMSYNQLNDLSAFSNCAVLKHVNLAFNSLYDIEVLEKSAGTLESLNLCGNDSIYDFDLEFLNGCAKLRQLVLDGLYLGTLSFISELEELEYLSAVDCGIRDISTLQKLTNLCYLNLTFNRISDISVLSAIANDNMILDLSFNDVEDVSALPEKNYACLNLTSENLQPYTVPAVCGEILLFYFHEDWLNADCINGNGKDAFTYLLVVDCPLDKMVFMENQFGKDRILFLVEIVDYLMALEECGIDTAYLTKYLVG